MSNESLIFLIPGGELKVVSPFSSTKKHAFFFVPMIGPGT